MKNCSVEQVRNFTLAGHAGAGKTTIAELMLLKSGTVNRLGSVNDGTSVSDFHDEEKEKKSSIFTSALNCPWDKGHFFFTDTPGYPDFCGEAIAAMNVADTILIVVDAAMGIGPGTRRAWKFGRDNNIPRAFFINGIDREQANFDEILASLQDAYGVTPLTIPTGDGVASVLAGDDADRLEALTESVAESDEELLEKYFEEGELTEEELISGLRKGIASGEVIPCFAGSAGTDTGIEELMNGIRDFFPSPVTAAPIELEEGELDRSSDEPVAYVFKSVNDPFIGQLTYFRVFSGTFATEGEFMNVTKGNKERYGSLLYVNGKDQKAAEGTVGPGEIVAVAKLKDTAMNDVIADKKAEVKFKPPEYPQPTMFYAVTAVNKGDEDKIGAGGHRLALEDATFEIKRDSETHETVISGMGDQHLAVAVGRLKKEFKVDVELSTPSVPYRETISAIGSASYRHKKQSGGHGQFAEVHLRLEPLAEEEFEFASEVVGGNIPKNYIPAVEKGVVETMVRGPLANSKVINIKAIVFDGKHHAVDSSEMAFKIAARGAFRDAMSKAKPSILEPIMSLKISFPEEYMGDISGDLNSRRGRILGMEVEDGMQVLNAEVPLAEVYTYSTQLRSITQGRGSFEMEFLRYETVPSQLAAQIQAAVEAEEEEE